MADDTPNLMVWIKKSLVLTRDFLAKFYNSHHPDPNDPEMGMDMDEQFPDGMFRFEKRL